MMIPRIKWLYLCKFHCLELFLSTSCSLHPLHSFVDVHVMMKNATMYIKDFASVTMYDVNVKIRPLWYLLHNRNFYIRKIASLYWIIARCLLPRKMPFNYDVHDFHHLDSRRDKLTHCSLGNVAVFLICNFQTHFSYWCMILVIYYGITWAPSQYKDRLIYVWRFPC